MIQWGNSVILEEKHNNSILKSQMKFLLYFFFPNGIFIIVKMQIPFEDKVRDKIRFGYIYFQSVSCSVASDSLRPHRLQSTTLLSVECSRQEYWSGEPFPFLGDLPDPGIEPRSPALQFQSSSPCRKEIFKIRTWKTLFFNIFFHPSPTFPFSCSLSA